MKVAKTITFDSEILFFFISREQNITEFIHRLMSEERARIDKKEAQNITKEALREKADSLLNEVNEIVPIINKMENAEQERIRHEQERLINEARENVLTEETSAHKYVMYEALKKEYQTLLDNGLSRDSPEAEDIRKKMKDLL